MRISGFFDSGGLAVRRSLWFVETLMPAGSVPNRGGCVSTWMKARVSSTTPFSAQWRGVRPESPTLAIFGGQFREGRITGGIPANICLIFAIAGVTCSVCNVYEPRLREYFVRGDTPLLGQ